MSAIVVGGGIVGRAAAFRLQRAGISVVLVDPDSMPGPASFGNAGHVATEQVRPITNPAFLRSVPDGCSWPAGRSMSAGGGRRSGCPGRSARWPPVSGPGKASAR